MISRPSVSGSADILPNPRGGAVPDVEAALEAACAAQALGHDTVGPLRRARQVAQDAGWLPAQRFLDALIRVAPLAVDDACSNHGAAAPAAFAAALGDFRSAVERHNLRELACSPALFSHYRTLNVLVAPSTAGTGVPFSDLALAGRPLPPVTMAALPSTQLLRVRARYERALLPALRTRANGSRAAAAWLAAAFDELEACLAELAGADPYDFWRLALACAQVLRRRDGEVPPASAAEPDDPAASTGPAGSSAVAAPSGTETPGVELRRFHARCNLALAGQARGMHLAPRELAREALALLWRDYALFGAPAEDLAEVELLHDYGLTVDWHVAGNAASAALWETGAAGEFCRPAAAGEARELGFLRVSPHAYEDFLQTADASIAPLACDARTADAGTALQASAAAYRLGAAASALGLGHVAWLADALGLAWRRRAHAGSNVATLAPALDQSAEALRAMLHKIAAGLAPPNGAAALAALTRELERGAL